MVNIWKKIPLKVTVGILVFILICMPKVEAKRYVMTYLYGMGNYIEMLEERENAFNEISPSYFDINEDGTLKLKYIDKSLINKMKKQNIKVVPFLSNHWDRQIGRNAVQNYENLSTQIANAVEENSLDGVNVDIENLTEIDRENYINLVKKLREKIPTDKMVVVSVAANPYEVNVGWQGSYDYKELSQYADYIMIMAYDEHYEGGKPGPVASITFVEKSIQYALKNINKEKIVLGIPLYGRFWKTNTGTEGIAVSLKQMNEILKKYDYEVIFDEEAKSPKAVVTVKAFDTPLIIGGKTLNAGQYEFWYEDEASVEAKFDLIEMYNLKGVGMWKIGLETTSVWETIEKNIEEQIIEIFDDVSECHWAYENIKFVNENGLMIGKSPDFFEPEVSLTRAELAIIIIRLIDKQNISVDSDIVKKNHFSDISGHWAEKHILELQNYGIINGYENNEFRPDNRVTRAEVCAIVNRMLNSDEKISNAVNYSDVSLNHWAYQDIMNLSEGGIVEGYKNSEFEPENTIKRCEIAKILQKICEKDV